MLGELRAIARTSWKGFGSYDYDQALLRARPESRPALKTIMDKEVLYMAHDDAGMSYYGIGSAKVEQDISYRSTRAVETGIRATLDSRALNKAWADADTSFYSGIGSYQVAQDAEKASHPTVKRAFTASLDSRVLSRTERDKTGRYSTPDQVNRDIREGSHPLVRRLIADTVGMTYIPNSRRERVR